MFTQNPTNELLNNHPLIGKFQGLRSINVIGDWRAVYSIRKTLESEREYCFELVGTHSQLYS